VARGRVAPGFLALGLTALLCAAGPAAADSNASIPGEGVAHKSLPSVIPQAPDQAAETPAQTSGEDDQALFEALDATEQSSYWDPIEPVNRIFFDFNELADKYFIGPVSGAYSFVMPDPAERAVRRMFRNLSEPISFANHMLQFKPDPAGKTFVRFCLNSTVGVAGAFDVANSLGMEPHPTDFGGTLYRYGAPAGPYLVVPLFGPTTVRDGFGDLVDSGATPQTYLFSTTIQLALGTGNGITARAEAGEALDALRDGAVDFYAALRSAYYFNRESELRGGAPGASETLRSNAATNASNPSRSSTEVYSALRNANSDTVPLK
jgi:phospholipid-binding lipoprotein MlaA